MALNPSIQKVVPASAPQAIASFDFFDVATGTGVQNFFGAMTEASGALVDYFLTGDNTIFSGNIVQKEIRSGGIIELSDLDYDVSFLRPLTINGKVRISVLLLHLAGKLDKQS